MPQSLSNISIHIVFSTKHRQNWLTKEIRHELYPYIAQILKNKNCCSCKIGGTENHIHILCPLPRTISISKLIEDLKVVTSKWIKTKSPTFINFHWQTGYAAFSISPGHIEIVSSYIENQEAHHKGVSFEDELCKLLNKYNIPFDQRYLFNEN